jgi:catechol 2,3-dioxygenase-like lactoylglutathione lyase family enzyme
MFNGAHIILYSRDAAADREFIRDRLGFKFVDAGDGWLIFKLPPSEIAVHPTEGEPEVEFYLMCDDISTRLAELAGSGVEIAEPMTEQSWGLLAKVRLPSGASLPIYEPRHPVAAVLD